MSKARTDFVITGRCCAFAHLYVTPSNPLKEPRSSRHERRDEDDDDDKRDFRRIDSAKRFHRERRQNGSLLARGAHPNERHHWFQLEREHESEERQLHPEKSVAPVEGGILTANEHAA